MRNVRIVIGANFGDEGKGKLTNMYAKNWADLVVRFNGGAQAAHTVVKKNGFRHVFGHLGSAAVDGVPTFLSKYFINNPRLFLKELDELSFRNNGIKISDVFVDAEGVVTTPYDVLVNQVLEVSRGNDKHGSCGVGIHETMLRSATEYRLTVYDLYKLSFNELCYKLLVIRDRYFYSRLNELNLTVPKELEHAVSDSTIYDIASEMKMFINTVKVVTSVPVFFALFDNVVFEGAQGLLLDEDHEWFPYVTHSKTGVCNVLKIIKDANIDVEKISLEVAYVTRAYMTRHGAGPFPSEDNNQEWFDTVDETNKPNKFQGSLRVGLLDVPLMVKTVAEDIKQLPENARVKIHMTCMDQFIKEQYFCSMGLDENNNQIVYVTGVSSIPLFFTTLVNDIDKDVEFSGSMYS